MRQVLVITGSSGRCDAPQSVYPQLVRVPAGSSCTIRPVPTAAACPSGAASATRKAVMLAERIPQQQGAMRKERRCWLSTCTFRNRNTPVRSHPTPMAREYCCCGRSRFNVLCQRGLLRLVLAHVAIPLLNVGIYIVLLEQFVSAACTAS